MSDGLVRIVNATVFDRPNGSGEKTHAPRAFVHRSHSGHFGIVNSEEGYQNLTRFLFGDVRVDGILEIDELSLPRDVQRAKEAGKTIRASYHFDVVVKVRGARWDLHRRLTSEQSAVFRTFDDMFPKKGRRRSPHLFSVFLASHGRVKKTRRSLGFAIDLKVYIPDYEIDGFLWADRHYEGTTLFDKTIIVEAIPPPKNKPGGGYRVRYSLNNRGSLNRATKTLTCDSSVSDSDDTKDEVPDTVVFRIPLQSSCVPGLKGSLRLACRPWNRHDELGGPNAS